MSMALDLLALLVLLAAVAWWVLAPLRDGGGAIAGTDLAALEAEWEARVAAVRDAELDLATGKLTTADHQALDAELRAAAVAAQRALERPPDRERP
jgi:hypothetical protein